MRRQRSFIVAAALAIAVIIAPASAVSAKPGAKCTKEKQTVVVSGKRYTCVKTGGKLVWNKGVAVTPKVQPAPAPVPTPTPAPVLPITFDNLDPVRTREVARQNVLAAYEALQQPAETVEFLVGAKVTSAQLAEEKRLLNIATRLFSAHFTPAKYQVVFFSQDDGEWAEGIRTTVGGNFPTTIPKEIAKWTRSCNFAFASRSNAGTPIYYQCLDSRGSSINDKQTAIHEYFHLVQRGVTEGALPCWLHEGSPTFFGIALGVDGADPTGAAGRLFYRNLANSYDPGRSLGTNPNDRLIKLLETPESAVTYFEDVERSMQFCTSYAAYASGGLATEALVAVKGFEAYMRLAKSLGSPVWKATFEEIYGLTPREFYRKLQPYIYGQLTSVRY